MPTQYFFVSALLAKRANDVWYSRVFPIDYTDENNLVDQQNDLQIKFTGDNQIPQPNNTPWSNGFQTFEAACVERSTDILKPGTTVHRPVWPPGANDCPDIKKRNKK